LVKRGKEARAKDGKKERDRVTKKEAHGGTMQKKGEGSGGDRAGDRRGATERKKHRRWRKGQGISKKTEEIKERPNTYHKKVQI